MCCEYQDRCTDPPVAQRAEHLDAAQPRQPQVQHDDIVFSMRCPLETLGSVCHEIDVDPLFFETAPHKLAKGAIVFHDEDLHDPTPLHLL